MKILLTGSHGFIGSHVRKELEKIPDIEIDSWDLKIKRDIADLSTGDFIGVDAVIHLAAYISVPHSYDMPEEYMINNTYHTLRMITRAVKAGVKKFIFASSSSVYGDPLSPYGASKLAAEKFLSIYAGQIDLKLFRFFNVYGVGQNPQYSGVITNFMKSLILDKPLEIYGDGEQTRDFVYVGDIVKLIIQTLNQEPTFDCGPFDIGKGQSISVNQLAAKMALIWQKKAELKYLPRRAEVRHSQANTENGYPLFKDFTPLEEGLQKLYEAINNNDNN